MPRVRRWLSLDAIQVDRLPTRGVLPIVDFLRNQGETKPIRVQKIEPIFHWQGDPANGGREHRVQLTPGGFYLLDGRHRYMAHRLLGRTHIEVTYGVRDTSRRQKQAA